MHSTTAVTRWIAGGSAHGAAILLEPRPLQGDELLALILRQHLQHLGFDLAPTASKSPCQQLIDLFLLRSRDLQCLGDPIALQCPHAPDLDPDLVQPIPLLRVQDLFDILPYPAHHGSPLRSVANILGAEDANRFYRTQFQRREDCLSHETYPDPLELPLRAAETTARQLFAAIDDAVGEAPMRLCLDRDLVVRLCCEPCETTESVMRPLAALDNQLAICPQCGQPRRPERTHQITSDSELVDQTLAQLGIPPYDLIRVVSGDHLHVIALAGDRSGIWSTPTE